jgi:iron complex outermembrane recepter protein
MSRLTTIIVSALLCNLAPLRAQAHERRDAPTAVASNPERESRSPSARLGGAASADNDPSVEIVEVVLVTASRREETVTDVAGAVTALIAEQLQDIGASQLQDFVAYVPGLTATSHGTGANQLSLRGVTTGPQASPTVGVYLDEVPLGSATSYANGSYAADINVFDLARVEVLNGPQGTLYGASSLGGLVKYVTNAPAAGESRLQAQGELTTTSSGDPQGGLRAMANLPFNDTDTALRVSGAWVDDAGYIDNSRRGLENVNSARTLTGRASFATKLADNVSLKLGFMDQSIERDGNSDSDRDPRTGRPVHGDLDQSVLTDEFFETGLKLYSALIDWDFGAATLTSVSGWQRLTTDFSADRTATRSRLFGTGENVPYINNSFNETEKFTQEIRLISASSDRFEWQGGLFFTREESASLTQILLGPNVTRADTTGTTLGFLLGIAAPQGDIAGLSLFNGDILSEFTEIAGYGGATVHFTDRFDVSVGMRYSQLELDYEQRFRGIINAPLAPNQVFVENSDTSESVATYLLNPRYYLNDHAQIYVRAASGYRPGGPNFVTRDALGQLIGNRAYESDSLWNYELGFKSELFGGAGQVEIAGYYIDWSDIQLLASVNGLFHLMNAGAARVVGVEAAGRYVTRWGLSLSGSVQYSEAELAEDAPGLGASKGARLPLSAQLSGAVVAEYAMPVRNFVLVAGLSSSYTGDRTTGFEGSAISAQYEMPDYVLTDLRLSLARADSAGVKVTLFAKNIFDERAQLSADASATGVNPTAPVRVTIAQPRTVGVRFDVEFGK